MTTPEQKLAHGFARAMGIAADEKVLQYVRQGSDPPSSNGHLLAWDANSIHAFVFDTTNATGIRGASDILTSIDRTLRNGGKIGLETSQILFSGGGSGLAVVSQAQIEPALGALHRLFALQTRIATCSAACVPLVQGDQPFNQRVLAADRALDQDRIQRGADSEPAVPFFVSRCEVCGRRAASVSKLRGKEPYSRLECEPCKLRIERGKRQRRFQNEPSDFKDIEDESGYALLYLDGNGVGRRISSLTNPLDYSLFSQALMNLMRSTFRDIAEGFNLSEDGDEKRKGRGYQLPICGGDDLVAILPARAAVPLATQLLAELEKRADSDPILKPRPKGLGAAAGVAIAHPGYPVRHLLTEAQALLKTAKKRVYRDGARSAINFAVIKDGSPRAESFEPERWEAGRSKDSMLLSGKPYELGEMQRLSQRLEIFRQAKLGRSQLFALQRQARAGSAQLRNHVLYQIARHDPWRKLIQDLSGRGNQAHLEKEVCIDQIMPVYGGWKVFDLADMLDLMDHHNGTEQEEAVS